MGLPVNGAQAKEVEEMNGNDGLGLPIFTGADFGIKEFRVEVLPSEGEVDEQGKALGAKVYTVRACNELSARCHAFLLDGGFLEEESDKEVTEEEMETAKALVESYTKIIRS